MAVHVDALMPSALASRLERAVLLHRGSRGVVIRAHDPELDRDVVVKLVEPARGQRSSDVLAEARLQARVSARRGVCPVLDAGTTDQGWVYLVLPFHHRGSLSDRLGEPIAPSDAAALGAQIADVLASVHAAGVVHGDLKPSNVLIDDQGDVLLADFGSAVLVDADSTLSDSAGVLGTLAYCAPEQMVGDPVSPSSDVYALGLTVAALVLGHSPQLVPGETPLAFLERVSSGDGPDLAQLQVPPAMAEALAALCDRDPTARPTAADAAQRLATCVESDVVVRSRPAPVITAAARTHDTRPSRGPGSTTRRSREPGGLRGRRTAPVRIAAVVLLAAGAGGAFGYSMAGGDIDRQTLTFCRAYGELSNSASELVLDAQDRFRGAPSIGTALDTMLNDLPRRYGAAYRRFESRSAAFPETIRDDLATAAPFVARIEMADYLAHLDRSAVFDVKRRVRLERLPEPLRSPAAAYAAVDQLATTTCGLPDSAFPGMKEGLVRDIAASFTSDGAAFFGDPANARLIPADAAELAPDMAPEFLDGLATAFPRFLLALLDQKPEVASALVAHHGLFLVEVIESAAAQGVAPESFGWVSDLRRTVVDPALSDRLDAAIGSTATGP